MSRSRTSKETSYETEGHLSNFAVLPKAPTTSVESKHPVSSLVTIPWKHEAAASLHNWKMAAHHMGSEMSLTKQDYQAAVTAASKRAEGKYKPHAPALFTLSKKGS